MTVPFFGSWRVAALSAGCLFGGASALGQSFSDVQYWVGSGANRAGFVVDWNDGKAPQALLWGYRWDGAATGEDMLRAIVAADPRLFANLGSFGSLGAALFGIGYDLNSSGGFNTVPALTFDAGGLTASPLINGRAPADSVDHWVEGSSGDGYWSYWDGGTANTPTWGFSNFGMSGRILTNNVWDGWEFAAGGVERVPGVPTPAVPAPAAAMVLAGVGIMARRRRCRAVSGRVGLAH